MSARDFAAKVGKGIGLEPLAKEVAGATIERMVGYWVMWHLAGGFDALLAKGWLSRSAVYRSRNEFRRFMGVDVEAFWPEAVAFFEAERKRMAA